MGKPELLPCPFCGGTNLSNRLGSVECLDCLTDGPAGASGGGLAEWELRAAEAWNRRTAPPVALPVVERVVRHPIVLEEGAAPLAVPGEPPHMTVTIRSNQPGILDQFPPPADPTGAEPGTGKR